MNAFVLFFSPMNMQQTKHSFIRRRVPGRTILSSSFGHVLALLHNMQMFSSIFMARELFCEVRNRFIVIVTIGRLDWARSSIAAHTMECSKQKREKYVWRRCLIVNSKRAISIISMQLMQTKMENKKSRLIEWNWNHPHIHVHYQWQKCNALSHTRRFTSDWQHDWSTKFDKFFHIRSAICGHDQFGGFNETDTFPITFHPTRYSETIFRTASSSRSVSFDLPEIELPSAYNNTKLVVEGGTDENAERLENYLTFGIGNWREVASAPPPAQQCTLSKGRDTPFSCQFDSQRLSRCRQQINFFA